jgi:hypothetical protein
MRTKLTASIPLHLDSTEQPDSAMTRDSGLLGGYEAILDTEIARRFSAEGKALGLIAGGSGPYLTYTFEGSQSPPED